MGNETAAAPLKHAWDGPSVEPCDVPLDENSIPAFNLDARVLHQGAAIVISSYRKSYPNEVGFTMDRVGTRICELCDGRRTINEIARIMSLDFRVDPKRIASDVVQFLEGMRQRGFVEHGPKTGAILTGAHRWRPLSVAQRREHMEAVLATYGLDYESVVKLALEFADGRPVFLAGSTTEGLGNTHSDVDVYVLDESVPDCVITLCNLGRMKVDVETWPVSSLAKIESTLLKAALELSAYPPLYSRRHLKFLHAATHCIVLGGHAEVEALQRRFDPRLHALYMARRRWAKSEVAVQDAVGAFYSRHLDYACSRTREALDAAINSYLNFLGDTGFEFKHRVRKLQVRVDGGEQLLEDYVRHQAGWPRAEAELARHVEDGLRFTRSILFRITANLELSPGAWRQAEQ